MRVGQINVNGNEFEQELMAVQDELEIIKNQIDKAIPEKHLKSTKSWIKYGGLAWLTSAGCNFLFFPMCTENHYLLFTHYAHYAMDLYMIYQIYKIMRECNMSMSDLYRIFFNK